MRCTHETDLLNRLIIMPSELTDIKDAKMLIYNRALHPELFEIFLEKDMDTGKYEAKIFLIGSGHHILFHTPFANITELLTTRTDILPDTGLLEQLPVGKNREYQADINNRIYYMLNINSEQMSSAVFESVYREMTKFAKCRGLFITFEQWADENELAPFSFIDYEKRPRELDLFCYHAVPAINMMIRTQSVFSLEPLSAESPILPKNIFEI